VAFALVALVLRLLHLRFTARVLIADDAVFFQQHARRFLDAWAAVGTPGFGAALKESVDHASLQGVVYPLFQSFVYRLAGGIEQGPLLAAQAVLGAVTVWLTYLTARRAYGSAAARVAGALGAVYAPFVLASGLLLAEALLLAIQAGALALLVAGLATGRRSTLLWGGLATGVLMLRPAFQYAGPLLGLALFIGGVLGAEGTYRRRTGAGLRRVLPYAAGVLLVAVPWMAGNGLVFGSYTWSRTGDAWQQIYWGIYPPNRGWWPPDSPVPPKFGVDSLPGAWAAGLDIHPKDLDYLEAAVQQVRSTPLQALATEVNKLYQAYLHPFNNYAEAPPLVGPLAVPAHRLLALLTLTGLALSWRRPAPSLLLGGALLAFGLPYLASHVDVRYTIPPAQVGMLFAGLAGAEIWRALRRRGAWLWLALALALPATAWALDVSRLTAIAPGLAPWRAHLLQTVLMVAGCTGAGWLAGRLLAAGQEPAAGKRLVASGLAAGALLAGVYGVQALYSGDWHEWSTRIGAGEAVRQTFDLPPGWSPPPGSRAEVRLYLQGGAQPAYEPVVRVDGREVARLGRAFGDAGPLRFDRVLMDSAARQGKTRADVPQWYAVPVEVDSLRHGRVSVEVTPEAVAGAAPGAAWLRVWGDFPLTSGSRLYEGPAVHSRILGADNAFHKLMATGHPLLWRRAPLDSPRAAAARRRGAGWAGWVEDDLSDAPGRQSGEYRIRLLVLAPNGDLLALF
jgi:hypothetical protein